MKKTEVRKRKAGRGRGWVGRSEGKGEKGEGGRGRGEGGRERVPCAALNSGNIIDPETQLYKGEQTGG